VKKAKATLKDGLTVGKSFLHPPSPQDLEAIKFQLGRDPERILAVLHRCQWGLPEVVLNYPLRADGRPFPDLFWLTCPALVKNIAHIEEQGWIKKLETLVQQDENLLKRFFAAQVAFQIFKLFLLQGELELPSSIKPVFFKKWMAGTSKVLKVKCLHAHFAFYCALGVNPIGKKVAELLTKPSCSRKCV
jgi:hypothetical protein